MATRKFLQDNVSAKCRASPSDKAAEVVEVMQVGLHACEHQALDGL